MDLRLRDKEAVLVHRILQAYLGDLRAEISDTDSSFFKEKLRAEEDMLRGILERLGPAAAEAGTEP